MKEAIAAALLAGCRDGDLVAPQDGAGLSNAWDTALFAAFDAARPPGRFESWARKSLPKIAAYFHVARLEITSPKRTDAVDFQRWPFSRAKGGFKPKKIDRSSASVRRNVQERS